MKILLLFPPKGFSSKEPLPPLGILYIATVLEKNNIPVEVVDTAVERYSWRDLKKRLKRSEADIVGITTTTEFRFEAFKTAELTKKILPNSIVVMGGPHVSLAADDTLKNISWVDIVVRGEGEVSFLETYYALKGGSSLQKIKGISFRENGNIIHNPMADLVKDLDSIPFPSRNLLPMGKYNFLLDVPGKGKMPAAHLITSRGCPFSCSFCATSKLSGRSWRYRSPENVVTEVEEIIERYGLKTIWFYDDTFNMNKARAEKICDLIIDKKLGIDFTCSIRVDMVDRPFLKKMKEAGCFKVFYGVESGSQRILDDACGKKITIDQVRSVSRWLDELEIQKNPGYIVSFPGETLEDANKTMGLIKEIGGTASLSILRIYPGTRIEEIAREKKIFPQGFSWSIKKYSGRLSFRGAHGDSPIFTDKLSWDDLSAFLMEWADTEHLSLWKRIPMALKGIKSIEDVRRLTILAKNYLLKKIKKMRT